MGLRDKAGTTWKWWGHWNNVKEFLDLFGAREWLRDKLVFTAVSGVLGAIGGMFYAAYYEKDPTATLLFALATGVLLALFAALVIFAISLRRFSKSRPAGNAIASEVVAALTEPAIDEQVNALPEPPKPKPYYTKKDRDDLIDPLVDFQRILAKGLPLMNSLEVVVIRWQHDVERGHANQLADHLEGANNQLGQIGEELSNRIDDIYDSYRDIFAEIFGNTQARDNIQQRLVWAYDKLRSHSSVPGVALVQSVRPQMETVLADISDYRRWAAGALERAKAITQELRETS